MNRFIQDSATNLFASPEDIRALSQKEKASVLVVSDSHGNYSQFMAVLEAFGKQCDAMVFCGDGISELARLAEEVDAQGELQDLVPSVIGFVEGNCDQDRQMFKNLASDNPYFVPVQVPLTCSMNVCGHGIFFTHGHRFSLYDGPGELVRVAENSGCDTVLFGHTHYAASAFVPSSGEENGGGVFILNPGSCARPRGGQNPCFAVIDVLRDRGFHDAVFYEIGTGKMVPFIPE